ncbi:MULTISPECIES: glycosyltransferase family 2 protein [unclassified Mucilaginibacter]|uniref:glycosyltransferase family 2 protein n=1 Tax=unclassified Mucilaginibacter TaxID=2617802 RepID=UPI00095AFDC7|nr:MULTISPECIES: glycosyltransferase [unclassified Mucilaginibacter]OJW17150.1 MAG: glycosyl transferase [Mucilaginibacter sp. 44-25]PLW89786.1 MAG: glycosyl transferase [Mucilaginibacter sp.]HEK21629.1 glycosyltransferase [Bacteroidota bacterium]
MIALHSIISLLLTGLYLLVVGYLIKGWAALKRARLTQSTFITPVTILIAARNEAERIHLTIEDILAQDYPKHLTEIIIVDDHSTDDTANIIRGYAGRGVKLLQLNEDKPLNSYKKKAIAEAIGMATGELMVCTDADCRMGTQWLSSVVSCYETLKPVMISSPVTYFEERSLFERLQTLEFSYLIGIGAAFIGNGRASTCNGANFAYRKDVFYEVGGFKGIDDLASGDDELLLQKVAEVYPHRIAFLKNRDAVVYTHAKHTLQEFLQQRRRWASKSTRYKDKKVVALAVCIWLFNLSLLVNAALGFYSITFLELFLVQFLLKYLIEVAFLLPITAFFKRPGLVSLLIILGPIHIIYFVYVGLLGNTRKYAWKGRVVR